MPADGGRLHVAIIMDGNGRWAKLRGLPRVEGHRAGARAVRQVVEAAPSLGITDLTLYAFSSDNWGRPAIEVSALMRLFREYLERETERCIADGVRLSVIGRRDRLSPELQRAIARSESDSAQGEVLHLRLAESRIVRGGATPRPAGAAFAREEFPGALASALGTGEPVPDVDLLIRTGGEQRLSDFLLWECAYAELCFTHLAWPEFGGADLEAAVTEFRGRERRFGLVASEEVAV